MYLKDFDKQISQRTNIKKSDARKVIAELEKLIKERLAFGEDININGVVKMSTKVAKATTKFNVSTREYVDMPARMVMQYKTMKGLKDKLSKKTVYSES